MKLIRAEISGFGHYRQATFDFSTGNQLFFGENETGKSTLYHFIQTMLFGFAKKSSKKRDYTPTDGAAFGGRLWIELPGYGEVQIERFRRINRGRAKIRVGEMEGDETWLAQLLAPLTLETFQEVFTFQQEQLSELDRLQEKELHDALISLGITGSAQVMSQVQQYEKENQQMYKLKGQKLRLNQQLIEWQQLKEKIQEKEQQERQVQQAYQKMAYYEKQAKENRGKVLALQQKNQLLEQQQLNWPLYEELQALQGVKESTISSAESQKIQQFYQEYQQISEAIEKKEAELAQLESGQGSERYFFYLDEEARIQQILREKVTMMRLLDESQRQQMEKDKLQATFTALQQKRGWQQAPEKSDAQIPERIEQLQMAESQLREANLRLDWLTEQHEQLEQEIASLEKAHPQLFATKPSHARLSYGLLSVGALGIGTSWFLSGGVRLGGLVLGGLVFLGGVFLQLQQSKGRQVRPLWQEKIHKQQELRTQQAQQVAQVTQMKENVAQAKSQLQPAFGQETDTSKWLQMVQDYDEEVATFERLHHKLTALGPREQALREQLQRFSASFAPFDEWLPLKGKELAEKIQCLEDFHLEMQEVKMNRLQQPSTLLAQQLRRQKADREALFEKCEALFATFGLTHPTEIPLWKKQWERQEKQVARKKELTKLLQPLFPEKMTKAQLQAQKEALHASQASLQESLNLDLEEKQRLQLRLEQLQADGTLDQLYQEETKRRAEIESNLVQWGKNRLLGAFLTDLATALSDQQLPQLLQQASYYFGILTNQEYQAVRLEEGLLFVESTMGVQGIYQLSTGTKDQLIMAIRFAYLFLQKETILSPVIIDDGWLHYDSQRKRQLARLFATFGEDYQIICLSSDQEMVSYYQERNQSVKILTQRM
ncbi:ATP-binding protein [Enterococcus sp. LJL98]